ncbi:hypothetical protein TNCT_430841 [Trichonephila clavata]|uniref:Uncharacterized protein n=1 Tax=Trichonephila clavata TaxID=2740835 RepID=A0A8X6FQW6_TRICU|nr:hypothetical protein TNCT_430841 [Trichonephila clavata]
MLSEHHQKQCKALSLQHFLCYRDNGEDFLLHIKDRDKTWCHHFQPEGKSVSLQWKHPKSPSSSFWSITYPSMPDGTPQHLIRYIMLSKTNA